MGRRRAVRFRERPSSASTSECARGLARGDGSAAQMSKCTAERSKRGSMLGFVRIRRAMASPLRTSEAEWRLMGQVIPAEPSTVGTGFGEQPVKLCQVLGYVHVRARRSIPRLVVLVVQVQSSSSTVYIRLSLFPFVYR